MQVAAELVDLHLSTRGLCVKYLPIVTFIYSPYIQQRTVLARLLAKHGQLVVRNCWALSDRHRKLQLISLGTSPKAISHDGKFLHLCISAAQLAGSNAKSLRNSVVVSRSDCGAADEHRLRRLRGQREEGGPSEASRYQEFFIMIVASDRTHMHC
jgi:hypothetical protein